MAASPLTAVRGGGIKEIFGARCRMALIQINEREIRFRRIPLVH